MKETDVAVTSSYIKMTGGNTGAITIDSVLLKDGVAHSGLVKLASSTASNS